MLNIVSEEFMASFSTVEHIQRGWPQDPHDFRKMRPGRITFAIRVISIEKVSPFKQIPHLLFRCSAYDTDRGRVEYTMTPTFHMSTG